MRYAFIVLAAFGAATSVLAVTERPAPPELVDALLAQSPLRDLQARVRWPGDGEIDPDFEAARRERKTRRDRLVARARSGGPGTITVEEGDQLLEACRAEPGLLREFAGAVTQTPDQLKTAREVLERHRLMPELARWFSGYRGKLHADLEARAASSHDVEGHIEPYDALETFAALDPDGARPLLERLADSGDPRARRPVPRDSRSSSSGPSANARSSPPSRPRSRVSSGDCKRIASPRSTDRRASACSASSTSTSPAAAGSAWRWGRPTG